MTDNKTPASTTAQQSSPIKKTAAPSVAPQQNLRLSPNLQQQISILNARVSNVNLANGDLIREMGNTFQVMAAQISALQKENADLKAKTAAPKTQ